MKILLRNLKGKKKRIEIPTSTQFYIELGNGDRFSLTHYPGDRHHEERLHIRGIRDQMVVIPEGSNTVSIRLEED